MFWIRRISDGLNFVEDVGWKGRYYVLELSGFAPDITQGEHRSHLPEPHPGLDSLNGWIGTESALVEASGTSDRACSLATGVKFSVDMTKNS